jgi:hypothetical protein
VRELRLTARRALVRPRRVDAVLRAALVAPGLRDFSLRDGHVRAASIPAGLDVPAEASYRGGGVFERFTERARQVVVLAQEEARALRHNYVGTEHLLLGLLREEENVLSRDARRAVAQAHAQATTRGHAAPTPQHLLLGLLVAGGGLGADVLSELGVTLEEPLPAGSGTLDEVLALAQQISAEHGRKAAGTGDLLLALARHGALAASEDDVRAALRRAAAERARRAGRLQRWEHHVVPLDGAPHTWAPQLDAAGHDGWELVAIVDGAAVLKRPATF